MIGGRQAAEKKLAAINPTQYAKSRNHLKGATTELSPYIRHGVLTLAEVKDAIFQKIQTANHGRKLIAELGWRDFWQQIWQRKGNTINEDQDIYKTGLASSISAASLPPSAASVCVVACAACRRRESSCIQCCPPILGGLGFWHEDTIVRASN